MDSGNSKEGTQTLTPYLPSLCSAASSPMNCTGWEELGRTEKNLRVFPGSLETYPLKMKNCCQNECTNNNCTRNSGKGRLFFQRTSWPGPYQLHQASLHSQPLLPPFAMMPRMRTIHLQALIVLFLLPKMKSCSLLTD